MKGKSKKHAVSLIVLVVTILVLSIIAAAVIISLSNANIMGQASQTVFKSDMANYKETYELYVTNLLADNPTYDRTTLDTSYQSDTNLFIKIFGEVEEKYQKGLMIIAGRLVYGTEDEAEQKILIELNMDVREKLPEVEKLEKISKDKSYVGYYVKIGEEYGVIFADLAVGGGGTFNGENYSYDAEADKDALKDYVVNGQIYGNNSTSVEPNVLEVAEDTAGQKDRFYVMALSDVAVNIEEISSTFFTWYDAAYDKNINNNDSQVTSTEFGAGKENTNNMITAWNKGTGEGGFGAQDDRINDGYKDMWGVIQKKVYGENYTKENKTEDDVIWFVPSKNELGVFAAYLQEKGFTWDSAFDLEAYYWSSSLSGASSVSYKAWCVYLDGKGMRCDGLFGYSCVRLATTY